MRRRGFCVLLVCAGIAQVALAGPPKYRILDLGPGTPVALNHLGEVLYSTADGHVGVWLPRAAHGVTAGHHDLGVGVAAAFNEQGQVVWSDAAGIHVYELASGSSVVLAKTQARSINNLGEVVGNDWVYLPAPNYGRPAGLGAGGGITINDVGQVATRGWCNAELVDLRPGGQGTSFPSVTGCDMGSNDRVYDMNASGQIACEAYWSYSENSWSDPYVCIPGSGIVMLECAERWGTALRINDRGEILGKFSGFSFPTYYVLWTSASASPTRVTELLPIDTGWTFTSVADLNNATRVEFVGVGQNPQGATHMFLATRVVARGDMNCDGTWNFGDINPFVQALTSPAAYATSFANCDLSQADINQNGTVGFDDINPFVDLLTD
jgi:hypothetical protein